MTRREKKQAKRLTRIRNWQLNQIAKAHSALSITGGTGICVGCGTTKNLQFHHIFGDGEQHRKDTGVGLATWLLASWILRNLFYAVERIESRCPKCHGKADANRRKALKQAA